MVDLKLTFTLNGRTIKARWRIATDPRRTGDEYAVWLLQLLQIAGFPDQEGYDVQIIDAMIHEDYMDLVMEACDGALLFASSCILGFQVTHGAQVARAVRERFPSLPIIWGGWFPSVVPETYLAEDVPDAVALGQGELTFRDVVHATRFSMPTFGESAIALRFIARGTNETNTNVATNLAALSVAM